MFTRTNGGSTLTVEGDTVLPLARRMLADADTVRRELAGLGRGRVRLGATPTLCASLVAETLSIFHTAHPAIELRITERGSRSLLDELAGGELDLALITTSDAAAAEHFTVTPLLVEELVVVSASSAPPLTSAPSIRLADVAALPQVAFSPTYDLRDTTDTAYETAGLIPQIVVEGEEMDAVLRFIERGIGVAVVPAMVLLERQGLRSIRLTHPTLTRTISIARVAGLAPTAAVEAMEQTIVRTATALAARPDATVRLA